jgi:hypothetical protein
VQDVAEVAKIVLTEPNHKNAVYELVGTFPMSYMEVAEVFSRVLSRDVRAAKEEIGDWRLRAKGMSQFAAEDLIKMFEYYDQWGLAGNPSVLSWILGRQPTTLETFVERTLSVR